ncbi:MAG: restriction endonuclease subunit S [Galactobacter sp.]
MRWPEVPLKRVAELVAGGTPSTSDDQMWSDDGIPWISISDMSGSDQVLDTKRRVSRSGQTSARLEVRPPGTVLFAMYASVGEVSVTGVASCWNQALLGILPDAMKLNKRFLFYVLKDVKRRLPALYRSNTQDNLNAEQVGELKIPLPSVEVQKRVADYLDRETAEIDALIDELGEADLLRGEQWRASRDRLLFGDTDASDVYTWAPDRGKCYIEGPLKFKFDVTLGKMLDEAQHAEGDESAPYVRAGNIEEDRLDLDDLKTMPFDARERSKFSLRRDDLLVVEGGSVGLNVVLKRNHEETYFQKTVNRARPKAGVDSRYYAEVLNSYRDRGVFDIICNKSTIMHLTAEKLEALVVPIPSFEEQRTIADQLVEAKAAMREASELIQDAIDLAKERRAALISAAVTGQIDVTNL